MTLTFDEFLALKLKTETEIAANLGVSQSAVSQWRRRVPIGRIADIEHETWGLVLRYRSRPDLYPPEIFKEAVDQLWATEPELQAIVRMRPPLPAQVAA